MARDGHTRFCQSCDKHVHDLSNLTRRQATELLDRSPNGFCARINLDRHGKIIFRDPPTSWLSRASQVALLGVSALAAQAKAFAQSTVCRIELKVTDAAGAVIPQAQIKITHVQDPQPAKTGTANNVGAFTTELPAGQYTIAVERSGFATAQRSLRCGADALVQLEVPLQVALMGEVVEVTEEAKLVPPPDVSRKKKPLLRRIFHGN